jgi:hypothetical protein
MPHLLLSMESSGSSSENPHLYAGRELARRRFSSRATQRGGLILGIGRMTEFIWSQSRIGSARGRSEMDSLPLARGHTGELGASRRGGRD